VVTQPGAKNPNWGGGVATSSHGYLLTKVDPGHHLANRNGYAYTHRLIAEQLIGRPLVAGERVKFRDGNRANCTIGNIYVVTKQTDAEIRAKRISRATLRKRGVQPVPGEAKVALLDIFEGLCAYCDAPADRFDHVHPVRHGGKTVPGNMVPACALCNGSKHARNVWEWADATGRQFRPETIDWLSHHGHLEGAYV